SCPALLFAHTGPWLVALETVFMEKYIVQQLIDFIWMSACSTLDHDKELVHMRKAAHTMGVRSAHDSVSDLSWGLELEYEWKGMVHHPIRATYEQSLEQNASCITYLVKTKEDNPINVVIKFITRYGKDIHNMIVEAGFVPKLLYHGKFDIVEGMPLYGTLQMVVMEYVDKITAYSSPQLPPSLHQELMKVIEYCHGKGFAFGNLQKPNVMITKDGKVQLIDFDWAECEGKVTYPVSISPAIDWPEGVQELGPILKQHDHDMLVCYHN
ncbi:uncharacterized protein BJ212DRAFT_1264183, partial [Suillus subaureus]